MVFRDFLISEEPRVLHTVQQATLSPGVLHLGAPVTLHRGGPDALHRTSRTHVRLCRLRRSILSITLPL